MNYNKDFEFMDAVGITSFLAQLDNMEKDQIQTEWIRKVVVSLAQEVQKLHDENDILINKVDEILKIVKGREK